MGRLRGQKNWQPLHDRISHGVSFPLFVSAGGKYFNGLGSSYQIEEEERRDPEGAEVKQRMRSASE